MLTGTQPASDAALIAIQGQNLPANLALLADNLLLTDIVPSRTQLLDGAAPVQTLLSETREPPPHSGDDYDWLSEVLEQLTDFVHRHDRTISECKQDSQRNVPALAEADYQWAHALHAELAYTIDGEHPLASVMEWSFRLLEDYEEKFIPAFGKGWTEPAEDSPIDVPKIKTLHINAVASHAFFSLGFLLSEGGKAEKALAAYHEAIRLQCSSKIAQLNLANAYNNRANLWNRLKQPEKALADYDEALRLNPKFAEAYRNRGVTKAKLGKHEEAIAALNQAMRLKPEHNRKRRENLLCKSD